MPRRPHPTTQPAAWAAAAASGGAATAVTMTTATTAGWTKGRRGRGRRWIRSGEQGWGDGVGGSVREKESIEELQPLRWGKGAAQNCGLRVYS